MKKIILFASVLLLLVACGDDLPPAPMPPGGGLVGQALAGMAGGLPVWAAESKNVAINPSDAYYGDGVIVSVSDFDYVYKNGYFFDSGLRRWERFNLQGEAAQDWLKTQGVGSIQINSNQFKAGENYAVVYACDKAGKSWDCNGNKWMLVRFNVVGAAGGEIPELANVDKFVINDVIPPFMVLSANALEDNFGPVKVIQYNARYKEPAGLNVVARVFDFNSRAELDQTISAFFTDIITKGATTHNSQKVGLYLSDADFMIAVWTSGKVLVYIETLSPVAANKEIINAYLSKYPSDLK